MGAGGHGRYSAVLSLPLGDYRGAAISGALGNGETPRCKVISTRFQAAEPVHLTPAPAAAGAAVLGAFFQVLAAAAFACLYTAIFHTLHITKALPIFPEQDFCPLSCQFVQTEPHPFPQN